MTALVFEIRGSHLTVSLQCVACRGTSLDPATLSDLAGRIAAQLQDMVCSSQGPLKLGGKHAPRSKSGCETCRTRRIKCDEMKPVCGPCRKDLNRRCTYGVRLNRNEAAPYSRILGTGSSSTAHLTPPDPPVSSTSSVPRWGRVSPQRHLESCDFPYTLLIACRTPSASALSIKLFFRGVVLISSPALINIKSKGPTARTERQLAVLWQSLLEGPGPDRSWSSALVDATCAIGAATMALATFDQTKTPALLDWSKDAAISVRSRIEHHSAVPGTDPSVHEKVLVLFQLLLLRDAYVADVAWTDTLHLCRRYIIKQGGPGNLLLAAQGTAHKSHLERSLVYLTVYETLGALSIQDIPQLLNCPYSVWLEDLVCAQEILHSDFGFSLPTLFLLSNLATLVVGTSSSLEADSLFLSLDQAQLATNASTPSPVRIQFGDLLLRHSMICHLLRAVFGFDRNHARLQQAGAAMLELLVEVTIRTGSMINLLHPLLMTAEVIPVDERERLQLILDVARFKADTADVEAVRQIINECWARRDAGESETSVWDIMAASPTVNIL